MKFEHKLSVGLLAIAGLLLYGVNVKAEELPYKPIKLNDTLTVNIDERIGDVLKVSVIDAENGGNSIIIMNCYGRKFYFDLSNAGQGFEKITTKVYAFGQAQSMERDVINYACSQFN